MLLLLPLSPNKMAAGTRLPSIDIGFVVFFLYSTGFGSLFLFPFYFFPSVTSSSSSSSSFPFRSHRPILAEELWNRGRSPLDSAAVVSPV